MILLALLLQGQPQWRPDDEHGNLLWPLGDGVTPPRILRNYLQAEVSGSVHAHAGIDLVPDAMDRDVWALEDGTIVRIDRDEDGDGQGAGLVVAAKGSKVPGRAFLYLHLDPDSIKDWIVGDEVEVDELLGRVQEDDGQDDPEHLHLTRVAGRYADEATPWSLIENLSIRNPLFMIDHALHEDTEPPKIELDEDALFRRNEVHGDYTPLPSTAVDPGWRIPAGSRWNLNSRSPTITVWPALLPPL